MKSPDVSAWKQALCEALHSSSGFRVLSLDGTMKIVMGLRRYETKIPGGRVRTVDDVVDHNTCVLTIRTLEGGVLRWVVVDNASAALHTTLLRSAWGRIGYVPPADEI